MKNISLVFCLALGLLAQPNVRCQEELQHASDSPARFEIKQDSDGLTISVGGDLFARYVTQSANKPYMWPIIGPTGKAMTRSFPMKLIDQEAKEQRDHPHHRGLWFGHESAGLEGWSYPRSEKKWNQITQKDRALVGGDSWHEQATFDDYLKTPKRVRAGKRRPATLVSIKHREFKRLDVNNERAIVVGLCDHLDRDGRRFLTEERKLEFRANNETRSIDFQQIFTAADGPAVFEDRKDAGIGIRVPASMAMDSKLGGKVINSDGKLIDKAWGQPAKWCDYHGPVDGEHLGIAFLSHPESYRFPSRWHVREYGLFAANPFGMKSFDRQLDNGIIKLNQDESLTLKHRLIFHMGDANTAKIEEAWQKYAKESVGGESK